MSMQKILAFVLSFFLGLLWPQISKANWTNLGIYGGAVYSVAIDSNDPATLFAGTHLGGGLFSSRDGGLNWTTVRMDTQMEGEDTFQDHAVFDVAIAPGDSNVVWAVHNNWAAYSRDGGTTWSHIFNRTMQRDCDFCGGAADAWRHCRAIAFHPQNPDVVYIGTGGYSGASVNGAVYRTHDGGQSWLKLNQGINLDYQVEDLAVDTENPDIVWAVTSSAGAGGWDGTVYRSEDGGATFVPISPDPFIGGILTVTPKPHDDRVVFVAGGWGVVRLTFDGVQWLPEFPIPDCVYASDVAFAPGDPDIVYASWYQPWGENPGSRLSISMDGGMTWQTFNPDPNVAPWPLALAVDPQDANRVYVGDQFLGVGRTIDQGLAWTSVNNGLDAVIVRDVDVDSQDTAHMIAASGSGLYERMSAATAWELRRVGNFSAVRFRPGNGQAYFGGTDGFLLRTENNGTTFDQSNNLYGARIRDIAVDARSPDTVFIATGLYGRQVLRSMDGGANFVPVLDGLNQAAQPYDMNSVVIDPADPGHLLAGGGNFNIPRVYGDLWESRDGGDTWQRTGLTDTIVNALLVDPRDSTVIYAGCGYSWNTGEDPLLKSVDGGVTWLPVNTGLPPLRSGLHAIWGLSEDRMFAVGAFGFVLHGAGDQLISMQSHTNNDLYGVFGTASDDVFAVGLNGTIIRYDGLDWTPMASTTTNHIFGIWSASRNDVYAVGQGGIILHYDGTAWSPMSSPTTEDLYAVMGSSANDITAAGTGGVLLHYDGRSWQTLNSGVTSTLDSIWVISPSEAYATGNDGVILAFDGSDWSSMQSNTSGDLWDIWGSSGSNLYAVGPDGHFLHYDGSAWSDIDVNPDHRYFELWGFDNDRVVAVDRDGGIWQYDGQDLVALRQQGSGYRSVTDMAFHRANPDIVYASTLKAGVYVTPNQADNWLNLGTPESGVYAVSSGSLYAATGAGMYQLTGVGVFAGTVTDADTVLPIDGATVATDLGNHCYSVSGQYMMVVPAGVYNLFASALDYQVEATTGMTVIGSDVTWHHFEMTPRATIAPAGVPQGDGSGAGGAGGGGYCFIHTLRAGSVNGAMAWLCLPVAAMAAFFLFRQQAFASFMAALFVCILLSHGPTAVRAETIFQQVGVASPPVPVGSGARATGMGGAFIAVADDATAASWNPAGLIQLEKPEISIVGAYTLRSADYTSDLHPEIDNSSKDSLTNLNYFSVAYPVEGFKNMVFSINYQRLYDFERSFDHRFAFLDGSGLDLDQQIRYDQTGHVGAVAFAGAIEITPRISVGATVNLWTDELGWDSGWEERYRVRSVGTLSGAPVTIDTDIEDRFKQFRGINANLGALWETRRLGRFGAVVKTPFTATMVHAFRFESVETVGPPVNRTTPTGPIRIDEEVKLKMPLSYGVGWSRRFGDAWTVALDISRTHWDDYTYVDEQGNEFSPIDGRLKSQSQVDPTSHLRFGMEYLHMLPRHRVALPLRFGIFYDPEPGEDGARDFYGLSLGTGVIRKRFSFDMAYQIRWGMNLDGGNLIADSKVDAHQHTLLASLIYYFGSSSN